MAELKTEEKKVEEFKPEEIKEDDPIKLKENIYNLNKKAYLGREKARELETKITDLSEQVKEYNELKEQQAKEQGKYQELYDDSNKEVERLKPLETRIEKYEGIFGKQLEDVLKGLTEKEKALYDGLPEMSVEDKLTWASKLKANSVSGNSPASERAGGGSALDEQEWRKIIEDKNKMIELSISDRPFYDKLIQFKRRILQE